MEEECSKVSQMNVTLEGCDLPSLALTTKKDSHKPNNVMTSRNWKLVSVYSQHKNADTQHAPERR